jgi:arylsulfatase A
MPTLRTVACLLASLGCLVATTACAAERKPNIVYIIIDELGYFELSHMGHPVMQTPQIDRLAKEGMRFTQMRAGGCVCAPTRSVLMTGQHLGHTSVRMNGGGMPLKADDVTVARVLKQAGYATGGFGKWGLGDRGTTGVPEKHGFDVFLGYYHQVHAHTFYPQFLLRNSELVELPGNRDAFHEGQTFSQYPIFEASKQFIRDNKDRPFFAYLCWTPPHGQWGMPKEDPSYQLYQDKLPDVGPTGNDARTYAAMVNLVDREVGEIMALLKELDLDDDTIVFFSGDNGGNRYFVDKTHPDGLFAPHTDPQTGKCWRGGKTNLYEGGLRVTFLARYPGKIPAGAVNDYVGSFADFLPTAAELAGTPVPANVDGVSLVPTLLGEQAAGRKQPEHKYLYWENGPNQRAVLAGNWKMIVGSPNEPKKTNGKKPNGPKQNLKRPSADAARVELYDLATDYAEETNVADKHPDVVARLQGYIDEAHTENTFGTFTDKSKSFRATPGISYVP